VIEKGTSYFKRCIESKTDKNKIKFGKKSIESFKKALNAAKKLKLKKKIPIIYEYLTQLNSIIAVSNAGLKKNDEAIVYFRNALFENKNSGKNNTQKEINAYILNEIGKLYNELKDIKNAKSYSLQAISAAKETTDENLLDFYIELNPIFVNALDLNQINNNYRSMVKLAKRSKRKKVKAQVYFDYARYLFLIKKDYAGTKDYLRKSKTIYNAIHLTGMVKLVENFYESKFDREGNPIPEKKEE
jgi:tetratricopeptide (TPR) repeat protein